MDTKLAMGIALIALFIFVRAYFYVEDKKEQERQRKDREEKIKRGEPIEKNNDYWY